MFSKSLLLYVLLLLAVEAVAQKISVGAAAKLSTMGYGADAVVKFHEKMDARIGYDMLSYGPRSFSFNEAGLKYDANATIKTGSLTALYDYYLAENIFVAVGAGINNFNINVPGQAAEDMQWGDVTIDKEKVGDFEFDIKPRLKISPYLGIGFGRAVQTDKLVGFAFEVGTYYMGSPDVNIEASGLLTPTAMEEHGQEALFESQLSSYGFYPVIKFSLNFKLASF